MIDDRPYGCCNVKRADNYFVKDGYVHAFVCEGYMKSSFMLRQIENVMSKDCRYDHRTTDPRCATCERSKTDLST